MEITLCDVVEFCSGHASKCMQRGDKQKCKCVDGWGGRDCSIAAGEGGDGNGTAGGFGGGGGGGDGGGGGGGEGAKGLGKDE